MFQLRVTGKQWEHACRVAPSVMCYEEQKGIIHYNEGEEYYQMNALAEIVIKQALLKAYPCMNVRLPDWQPNAGYDININRYLINIKCLKNENRPTRDYKHNLDVRQIKNKATALLFSTYDKEAKTIYVCGWLDIFMFEITAERSGAGNNDILQITQHQLRPLNDIHDIKNISL